MRFKEFTFKFMCESVVVLLCLVGETDPGVLQTWNKISYET